MSTRDHAEDGDHGEGAASAGIMWTPEPGACAGRLDPDQTLVPSWLAQLVDWHIRPSASAWAVSPTARVVCSHIDWEQVWVRSPELFERRFQSPTPSPPVLWSARRLLVELGYDLIVDVQFENDDGQLVVAIYGAGVLGELGDHAWHAVASLLTTCACTLREPRTEYLERLHTNPLHLPTAQPSAEGRREIAGRVFPETWLKGDWAYTWWSYPVVVPIRADCVCSAHVPNHVDRQFGPRGGNAHM